MADRGVGVETAALQAALGVGEAPLRVEAGSEGGDEPRHPATNRAQAVRAVEPSGARSGGGWMGSPRTATLYGMEEFERRLRGVRMLTEAIGRLGLELEAAPRPTGWRFHRVVTVKRGNEGWAVPVDDEYEDIGEGRLGPVALHLVLSTFQCLDEAATDREFLVEMGMLDVPDPGRVVAMARAARAGLGPILGDLEPIDPWDWEMNTGIAKALRAASETDDV